MARPTQPTDPVTRAGFIKGTMVADFNAQRPKSRDGDYPTKGVADTLTVDLGVHFTKHQVTISCLPLVDPVCLSMRARGM